MPRKFTAAQIDYAESLVRNGELVKDAAAAIRISPDVLSKKLRDRGIDTSAGKRGRPAHNRITSDFTDAIKAYISGESILSVSKRIGVSRVAFATRLSEAGVYIRSGSEANIIRMQRLSFDERRALSSSARVAHMLSIQSNAAHHSIGPGEIEISEAIESLGYSVSRQFSFNGGNIDLVVGDVAVEIKQNSGACFRAFTEREKQIVESGMRYIFIGFDYIDCISERLQEIVALFDFAYRQPPSTGKHWVIKCRRYSRRGSSNIYDLSIELSPNDFPNSGA